VKGLSYALSQRLRVRLGGEPALGGHGRANGDRIVPLGSVILFALRELSALSKLTENDRRRGVSPQADLAGPSEGG